MIQNMLIQRGVLAKVGVMVLFDSQARLLAESRSNTLVGVSRRVTGDAGSARVDKWERETFGTSTARRCNELSCHTLSRFTIHAGLFIAYHESSQHKYFLAHQITLPLQALASVSVWNFWLRLCASWPF